MARKSPKFKQGYFQPKNPNKYRGKHVPIYRSGWELAFMRLCDDHPNVECWASESHSIPYRNPFTGKMTKYIPDFLLSYADKNGKKHIELVEVKPSKQAGITESRSRKDKAAVILNKAKWDAAQEWCKRRGIKFRIVTENEIYHKPQK